MDCGIINDAGKALEAVISAWHRTRKTPDTGSQGLFLTYFYCSVSRASLLCTGTCWAQHRCRTGHSWVRRQL